jgi:hypothetical protein
MEILNCLFEMQLHRPAVPFRALYDLCNSYEQLGYLCNLSRKNEMQWELFTAIDNITEIVSFSNEFVDYKLTAKLLDKMILKSFESIKWRMTMPPT